MLTTLLFLMVLPIAAAFQFSSPNQSLTTDQEEGTPLSQKEENENNEEYEDRLSDLPNSVILCILSFLNTKDGVRTCVLSRRWKDIWKHIPTLVLDSSRFDTVRQFEIFMSKILTLRDNTIALHSLDFDHIGKMEHQLLQKILDYVYSHKTKLQRLRIFVHNDNGLIMQCVSSCKNLTSLRLSIYPRMSFCVKTILFPKSLNLPALETLDLSNFTFYGWRKRLCWALFGLCQIEEFDHSWLYGNGHTNHYHINSPKIAKIELSTPSLCTFTFYGIPHPKICRSNLSSVKEVKIYARMDTSLEKLPMVLFNWLQELLAVKSLKVSSITLQILSLVPDLLEVKLPSLCNLKLVEIKMQPLSFALSCILKDAMLMKAAAKSPEEAADLRKTFGAGLEPPSIPDGIVDFLLQNSSTAKVNIS
ncbi:cytochrome C biogenesis protein ccsA [Medicago truncatula]|uniref:Cytochrome C biogenesis protein ccsA n=1 Tax=Medicago truncatula TaxID=3880 RepID=G7JSY2_MEDTR|nr:cytochrome C biogenesis protein ccsA [Medicago truncatula]